MQDTNKAKRLLWQVVQQDNVEMPQLRTRFSSSRIGWTRTSFVPINFLKFLRLANLESGFGERSKPLIWRSAR